MLVSATCVCGRRARAAGGGEAADMAGEYPDASLSNLRVLLLMVFINYFIYLFIYWILKEGHSRTIQQVHNTRPSHIFLKMYT